MAIQKYLKDLWMSEVESQLFITCQTYWWSTISSLARITSIARTTVHDAIQKMIIEWWLLSEKKWKWYYYTPIDMDGIEWVLMKKKLSIQKQITTLPTIKNEFEKLKIIDHSFTNIQYYRWIQAISTIYKKIQYSKTLRAVFNPEKWVEYSDYWPKELSDIIIKNGISSFEILGESVIAWEYQSMMKFYDNHEIKILPQSEMSQFHADHLITDDKFFFITFGEEILWIEITNKIFVEAQKVIFDGLWSRL